MAFEVCANARRAPLPNGQARIDKTGRLRVTAGDLERAGIPGPMYVVMIDKMTWRLALRSARDGERDRAHTVRIRSGQKSHTLNIYVGQALQELGVKPGGAYGSYDVLIKPADGLLIIHLGGDRCRNR